MRCAGLLSLLVGCLLGAAVSPAAAAERAVPKTEPAPGAPDRIALWPAGQVPGRPLRSTPYWARVWRTSDVTPGRSFPVRVIRSVRAASTLDLPVSPGCSVTRRG